MDSNEGTVSSNFAKWKRLWSEKFSDKWWILLILIPLAITFLVRLEPMKLAPLERSAEANVLNQYRSYARAEVDKQWPNLPESKRAGLAEQKLQELIKTDPRIREQIKQGSQFLKSQLQYQSGKHTYVYLGDIDSYYWLRQSRNILEKGTQCDVIKDGKCYDSYTTAPNLLEKAFDYYPITIIATYKFLKIFNPDISLMQASFLTPLIFSLIFSIPLFLLLRRLGGNVAAIIGTILVNVNPYVLTRSLGSDTDINNTFFQVFFLWAAIECFYAENLRKKIIWAALSGVVLVIYSRFWTGWWYLADLFILSLLIKSAYIALLKWFELKRVNFKDFAELLKQFSFPLAGFLVVIIIFYSFVFLSPKDLIVLITSQLGVLTFKVAANTNSWPNVLTTVAEFNPIGIAEIINSSGHFYNIPIFLFAIIGMTFLTFPSLKFINRHKISFIVFLAVNIIIYFLIKSMRTKLLIFTLIVPVFIGMLFHLWRREQQAFHPDVVFMLTAIITLVIYFSLIGARFLFLMAVPVTIFVALFFANTWRILISLINNITKVPKIVSSIVLVLLIFIFLNPHVERGFAVAQGYLPSVTDQWAETLEKIRDSSKPDAIINSWWDFGHWFKYFADRRVTLDGSSQNNPQLHWLGKLLLTSNETMAVGILRMLDCGGNNAFDAINEKMNDTPHSIDILNKIIVFKKDEAMSVLEQHNFSSSQVEKVLQYSHCEPPENFLITSEDMIGKGGVWAHFGSWDFKKSYLSLMVGKMPDEQIIGKFREDYEIPEETTRNWIRDLKSQKNQEEVNRWIAPWPSYYSGWMPCQQENNTFVCFYSQGSAAMRIVLDFDKKMAEIYIPNRELKKPEAVAFVTQNSFELIQYQGQTIPLGITAYRAGNSVRVLYMDPALTGSMFTRLFFLDALGLKSFEKFYDTTSVFGTRIVTWKVNWDALGH